jgi:hypothetical protein
MRESRVPYPTLNALLEKAAAHWPQLELVDWNAASQRYPSWFQTDDVHLTPVGGLAMAHLTHAAVMQVVDPLRVRPLIPVVRARMSDFLQRAVAVVRARFGGKVSYASLPFEGVDWTLFDIIATDAGYRTKEMAPRFRQQIRGFVAQGRVLGKPVAITEFGCMTYRGAADLGGSELSLIEWDNARPARLRGDYVRDEDEQASYLSELLEVFESERVDNAFVYTFARYDLPHRSNAGEDFDLASRGIVKVLEGESSSDVRRYPGMPWEPKAAFDTLAEYYCERA